MLRFVRCSQMPQGRGLSRSRTVRTARLDRAGLLRIASLILAGSIVACSGSGRDEAPMPERPAELDRRSAVDELVSLGDRVRDAGDLQTALALYLQASARSDRQPRLWLRLGATLSALGHCKDAVRSYDSVLALMPDNVEALVGLGRCWIRLGEPEAGKAVLLRAVAEDRKRPDTYQMLGIAFDLLGRHDDAQRAYRRGLRIAPKDVDLRSNLALSLSLAGKHARAVRLMEELLADPSAKAGHELNFALILSLCKKDVAAERIIKAVLNDTRAEELMAQFRRIREIPGSRERALEIGTLFQRAS